MSDGTAQLRAFRERMQRGEATHHATTPKRDGTAQLRRYRLEMELALRFTLASKAERYRPAPPRPRHPDDMRPLAAVLGRELRFDS